MEKRAGGITSHLFGGFCSLLRRCMFGVLSVGPVPNHIAFIMDGNRRYAKKRNMAEGDGHKAGFSALLSILRYCYELGVKYVSVYAFSIDNFKRRPKEVQSLMDLMREKIEEILEQESIVNEYGIRLHFIGNLQLLTEPVRVAMEKAMRVTAHNNQRVLLICIAYTSRDEMVHAVQESCKDKRNEVQASKVDKGSNGVIAKIDEDLKRNDIDTRAQHSGNDHQNENKDCCSSNSSSSVLTGVEGAGDNYREAKSTPCSGVVDRIEESSYKEDELPTIKLVDVEKNMYMSVAPDPDILIRTSGETRLSNFLLWQTSTCPLYSPAALWPEIGLWNLVWAVLNFQRHHSYLEKKKKQS
ncbi:dehydrodolichyl diphosphate synthase 6-like [Senna tora]|uniref:Alkyl transferase n=1 Tax=Senna tora TaxID=362788 RepID=A0A834TVN8_9FABA|nr:dehydrodolichyl diphosphate synthase 6-like [Senna tora]